MKDFRFTGHIDGNYVDVTFRTDMINDTDASFNITQIKEGPEFSPYDKQDPDGMYLRYFSGTFKETNTTAAAMYTFAVDNGLNLRRYDAEGNPTSVVHDHSDSTSAYN